MKVESLKKLDRVNEYYKLLLEFTKIQKGDEAVLTEENQKLLADDEIMGEVVLGMVRTIYV